MSAKIIPFPGRNPEQPASPEERQALLSYVSETEAAFTALRNEAWLIDPQMILDEDGLAPKQPADEVARAIPQAATNVIGMVSRQEQRELTEQERRLAEIRASVEREAA